MKLPLHRRLSIQITVPIVIIALFILASLSYYLIKAQQEESYRRAELELRSMVIVAQGSLSRILAVGRNDLLAELISEMRVHPQVQHVFLLDSNGEFIADYTVNRASRAVAEFVHELDPALLQQVATTEETDISYHQEHKHFVALVPVIAESTISQQVRRNIFVVVYDHDYSWLQLSSLAIFELGLFLAVLLTLGLLFWLGLQFAIVRPVKTLMIGVERLARRESLDDLHVPAYNELRLLKMALINAAKSRDKYEERLRRLTTAVEQSNDSIIITDLDNRIQYVNKTFTEITGYSADEVMGRDPKLLASGKTSRETYQAMWDALRQGKTWQGELFNRRKDGVEYREWATISPLRNDHGEIINYLASKQNITERRAVEAQLNFLANYDARTGLPNRPQCIAILNNLISQCRPPYLGAALLFDVDDLQRINDVRGFEFGDEILLIISQRINQAIKQDRDAQLGSLGGDLFIVMVPPVYEPDELQLRMLRLVDAVLREVSRPMNVRGERITVTMSAGLVVYPDFGDTAEAVIRHGETAVHHAKDAGGNQLMTFNPAYREELEQHFEIETALRDAIGTTQLHLALQPQHTPDGTMHGVEVLCRWQHPERGRIAPGVFIPIAERSDLIVHLGRWIVAEALQTAAQLPEHLTVAINVSPRHFREADFVPYMLEQIERSGVNPARLVLEVTENLLVDDLQGITDKMNQLKVIGVQLSIDDFGTGYSSLSYLSQLPIDELKIDQGFVQGIGCDSRSKIVETIVSMGQHLGLRIVAEGIETKEQLDFLANLSEHIVCQGYYFHVPMPLSALLEELS